MKSIKLPRGYVTIVDDEDFMRFGHLRWQVTVKGRTAYVKRFVRKNGTRHSIQLHRAILEAEPGSCVDHIDGDGRDARRVCKTKFSH